MIKKHILSINEQDNYFKNISHNSNQMISVQNLMNQVDNELKHLQAQGITTR
jgi:hypothetical protein